jgi:hypothetical protein
MLVFELQFDHVNQFVDPFRGNEPSQMKNESMQSIERMDVDVHDNEFPKTRTRRQKDT